MLPVTDVCDKPEGPRVIEGRFPSQTKSASAKNWPYSLPLSLHGFLPRCLLRAVSTTPGIQGTDVSVPPDAHPLSIVYNPQVGIRDESHGEHTPPERSSTSEPLWYYHSTTLNKAWIRTAAEMPHKPGGNRNTVQVGEIELEGPSTATRVDRWV